jgi:hypothetical protein
MLYNFHDGPADLFERMRLNVSLNEELGIRIWSFPMRFQPTDRPDRGHVGKNWSRYELRSMQIVLQATHGVVSGTPEFFRRAFGDTFDEFQDILLMPHDMIFNRDWFERLDGRGEFDSYRAEFVRLSSSRREELKFLISSVDPSHFPDLINQVDDDGMRSILRYYVQRPKSDMMAIWQRQKHRNSSEFVPDDERVEDAALDFDDDVDAPITLPPVKKKAA